MSDKTFRRKQKLLNQIKGIVFILMVVALVSTGHYLGAMTTLVLFYLFHELFSSDHIFYNPRQDYLHNLNADRQQSCKLQNGNIELNTTATNTTKLLRVRIQSTLTGYIIDPYVTISIAGRKPRRQYFERRLNGVRYINISPVLQDIRKNAATTITLKLNGHHCVIEEQCTLLGFDNPMLDGKKILIIAPHADDAELAAFGLYSAQQNSTHKSFIATITAGEIGAKHYNQLTGDQVAASRLKGRLRAWDSIMVAQWGGVQAENTLQLGYFCLTLEQMAAHQDQPVTSRTADISDTRYFRDFNSTPLASDRDGQATWNNLVQDLTEILQQFKPDIIVTPHPQLDPHRDHIYASKALITAAKKIDLPRKTILLYANHYHNTDIFPFGCANSIASLPPYFDNGNQTRIFSHQLTPQQQQDKVVAIAMMHDLQTPIDAKKKLRKYLQHFVLVRDLSQYGDDDYLRKAVRCNEIFHQIDMELLQQLLAESELK